MVRPFQGVSLAVIGLVLVGACPSAVLAQDDEEAGFRAIFNGRDLTGWEGAQGLWSVEDGAITGRTTPETRLRENSFLIWRDGLVDDFVLRLRYRIVNGNSGIQYRSEDRGRFVVGGYQADIDSADNYSGILYEERGRGILATRGQSVRIDEKNERSIAGSLGDAAALQRDIKKEDWNDYEIVARGNRIEHRINGKTMVEVVDGSKEHAKREGILALQIHVGPPMTVQFKDVRIKRLPLEDEKKIVLVAGRPSHGPGDHEHNAGVELLAKCLDAQPKTRAQTYLNGWPRDPSAFDNADSIVLYMDGGDGHPVNRHLDQVEEAMKRGAGLVCIHYAVEVPKGDSGNRFLDWIGGYFETHWSVNPHWDLKDGKLAEDHPITRGVEKPFNVRDEWYYNMRFPEGMKGVTPILIGVPSDDTRERPDGPHSNNPYVRGRKGEPEIVAWARERENGGRGFGFTGGHFHRNWGHDGFRKLVLNAIVWTAKGTVPEKGVESTVSDEDLEENLDEKGQPRRRTARPAGAKRWESDVLSKGKTANVEVDIRGAKKLYLVVDDAGDGFGCDWADWAEPRLVGRGGEKKLTEIRWAKAESGWGQVRVDRNANGDALRIDGKRIDYGIGTHAPSVIEFDLPEGYRSFRATVGLDEGGTRQGCGSTVRFSVYVGELPETARRALFRSSRGAGPLDPEESLELLETHEDLEVTLFAAEPLIINPTNIDVDARGRVWVLEGANYRAWQRSIPEGDRIAILEDTDGDGRADSSKTFYRGKDIDSALGICVLGNRVIVSRSPHVFIFTDEDGDDVADKKDILFSGIAGEQHDHGVHAFVVGPDGKLYFNMGDQGQRLRDAKGEPVVDRFGNRVETNGKPYRKGLALRLDPDTMEVEVLGHNFRNNYELAVDAFGTVWQSDNDDDGNRGVRINYVMQHGNFGYTDEMTGAGWGTPRIGMHPEIPSRHWYQNDPGVVPNFLQTGAGSPTGICVYEGTLLPEVFRGEVIHCEPGQNVVRAYPAKKSGAGYAGSIVDIVKATDRWFRPADVCVDVDGGLMIADWYDAGVGGHHMADNDPRQMRGRIYRVAPKRARRTIPAFDISTPESAARELVSPNHERRYLAMSALRSMGERAEPAVAKLWSDPNPRTRARALHFLARLPGRAKAWIERAVADENADLRVAAVRIALDVGDDVLALGRRLADDAAPEVRREVALSLFGVDSPESASLWAKLALAHDGKDRWYLEALGIGAAGKWDACFDAWLEKVGDPTSTPASRDIVWRSRATRTPELLARILLDPSTAKEERARTIRAFDFVPRGETREAALVELAASGDELVREEALKRLGGTDIAKRPELASVVARLVEKSRGTERYPRLVQTFALEADAEALLEVITEHPGTSGGALAARLLLDKGDEGRVRAVLQGEDVEDAVKLALALGNAQDARAVAILADLFSREETDPAILGQAVRSLARTRPGAERVLALATPEAFDEELLSIASLALSSSPFDDVRAKAIATLPAPPNRDAEPLPPLSDLVKRSGDPARGRQVFGLLCATCHKVGSEGHDFGPELSLIGDKLGKDALFLSILDPNAGVSFNYEGWRLALRSGDEVIGIIVSETDDRVTVKSTGDIVSEHAKAEIVEREKLATSLMPSNLQQAMSTQEIIDLVEFLSRARKSE